MDARDRLRQYLEQRKEMGEEELVLDGLSVDELMRVVGLRATDQERVSDPAPRPKVSIPRNAFPAPEPIGPPADGTPAKAPDVPGQPIVVGGALADGAGAIAGQLESLAAVAEAVAACTLCSLHATATNPVPGEGNPKAGFVCVGEAPGQKEDETGRPFVGKSGELLSKILEAIKFKREDVFICNVIKHRPPGNRNPQSDEIAACSPFLMRQLALLQPRVILALGTFAAQTLLQTSLPIGKLRGQIHRFHGVPLIVTYHPAALLRNPNWKRPAWEDVKLARRIFDSPPGGA